jgi:hypothetical protein
MTAISQLNQYKWETCFSYMKETSGYKRLGSTDIHHNVHASCKDYLMNVRDIGKKHSTYNKVLQHTNTLYTMRYELLSNN